LNFNPDWRIWPPGYLTERNAGRATGIGHAMVTVGDMFFSMDQVMHPRYAGLAQDIFLLGKVRNRDGVSISRPLIRGGGLAFEQIYRVKLELRSSSSAAVGHAVLRAANPRS
jgi:hypothetical protein